MVEFIAGVNPCPAPVCTVCIANYNGESLLEACLDSILSQSLYGRLQIIVHDDASLDGSVALIKRKYPQVDLLISTQNVGFCVANNRMVDLARAPYVLLLNNDAALFPDGVETLLTMAEASAQPAVLTLPQYDWQTGDLVDRGCRLDYFYNPVPNVEPRHPELAMTIGACLWAPVTLWRQLGGLPDWMESLGEDLFFCCLARLRGARVLVADQSGYRHWQGKTFGGNKASEGALSTTMRRRRLSERNKTYALFVCTPSIAMWAWLTLHLCLLLSEGCILALLKRDLAILTGIYLPVPVALLKNRAMLMDYRSQVSQQRSLSLHAYFSAFTWIPRKLSMLFRYGIPHIGK
ncbi:glycosyltransferase [Dyella sp. BiH032]|uniref:glycosyltransferase family 2 protein n=1 Tax=Dyella sp. BiH032 TaxID=3075430 RepID=UPI0028935F82|nr:glycosyltransferase [Dyella sp. BiH032]WNL45283.1 glycosyltransferase [Dyella sp. BiH032]